MGLFFKKNAQKMIFEATLFLLNEIWYNKRKFGAEWDLGQVWVNSIDISKCKNCVMAVEHYFLSWISFRSLARPTKQQPYS